MSVTSTWPSGPTRRAIVSDCSPAPAATSRTREPASMPASSIIASVAAPSQEPMTGPHRCQASAASCHCARVVDLKATGSKVAVVELVWVVMTPRCDGVAAVASPRSVLVPRGRGAYGAKVADYGQFCTVARGAEILCERWTALVVRELMCGSTHFNELRRGVPRMSPTLLSKRLRRSRRPGSSSGPARQRHVVHAHRGRRGAAADRDGASGTGVRAGSAAGCSPVSSTWAS